MNMYDAIKGKSHYLPENRVKYYMYQLLKSIDHMHRNGIFHRDIKPANILVDKYCNVRICDLGLARPLEEKPKKSKLDLMKEERQKKAEITKAKHEKEKQKKEKKKIIKITF